MASDAGEVQTGSAMMATTNQAEKRQAEEEPENLCSICLSEIVNAASVEECFHTFCFKCIQQWAAKRPVCPLCMQSFNHILLSVNADQYQVYMVGSSTREQRTMAVHRRSLQQRYHLRPRPTYNQTAAGRRRRY